jgi:hypothetical protein
MRHGIQHVGIEGVVGMYVIPVAKFFVSTSFVASRPRCPKRRCQRSKELERIGKTAKAVVRMGDVGADNVSAVTKSRLSRDSLCDTIASKDSPFRTG